MDCKISVAQCRIFFEKKEENQKTIARLAAAAAKQGTELVLFPELTLTGFTMNSTSFGEDPASGSVKELCRIAKDHQIALGFGRIVNHAGALPENHYTIISSHGTILGDYAKIHPFSYAGEDRHYTAGNCLVTFEFAGLTFGLTICYDLRFPELYQCYAEACDCIIVAANWPEARDAHWDVLTKARAIETQCYVAAVNCLGDMDGQTYIGHSRIISPTGEILADAGKQEGVFSARIQKEEAENVRLSFPVRKDRRPEIYHILS